MPVAADVIKINFCIKFKSTRHLNLNVFPDTFYAPIGVPCFSLTFHLIAIFDMSLNEIYSNRST